MVRLEFELFRNRDYPLKNFIAPKVILDDMTHTVLHEYLTNTDMFSTYCERSYENKKDALALFDTILDVWLAEQTKLIVELKIKMREKVENDLIKLGIKKKEETNG